MRCPKCISENVEVHYDVEKQGFSGVKGCCGWFLMGPIGLLCGLCGKNKVKSETTYWVCKNCGTKFSESEGKHGEEEYKRRTAEKLLISAENNLSALPNYETLLQKKSYVMDKIRKSLSEEELKRVVFFDATMDRDRACRILSGYVKPEIELDLSDECIYFMYNESIVPWSNLGTIFTSKGIYHYKSYYRNGTFYTNAHVFTPASIINKIYVDKNDIIVNEPENLFDFAKIKRNEAFEAICDCLRNLYLT